MRVLLCENDCSTAAAIELFLSSEGVICETVDVAETGIELVRLRSYDALIIDVMLNGVLSGCDAILRLRAAKIQVPILIISGLSSIDHKIKGLGFGADDYMTKPFCRGELLARLQAIIRRARGHSESVIRFGPHGRGRINIDSRTVHVEGYGDVNLTSKEYSILELLALRKGCVISKEAFLNHLYGGYEEPHVKIVDVFCCKTRKKLNHAFTVAKKLEKERRNKILEGDNIEEINKIKQLEIEEGEEDNKDDDECCSGIATLWGRGYVLKEFNEKNMNKIDHTNNSERGYWNSIDAEDNIEYSGSSKEQKHFDSIDLHDKKNDENLMRKNDIDTVRW